MMKFTATIAGECSVSHDIMRCIKTIVFQDWGHRFATKTVNEKLTQKNTHPLRKSLKKSVLIENKNVDSHRFFCCFSFLRCECILNIVSWCSWLLILI